ncbi:MAG TPA: carboxypeptidase-like regulatory domain-containing protein [Acidobacteriaceae bacterium]|jgi:tetratricopeptide (TPR) repeat protein|nr:carboxypeptidase-like regulatory domain-containing protein [Acidobacteriaceae bacterium]
MYRKKLWPRLALAAVIAFTLPLTAQINGKIHGHVNDPEGVPLVNGTVSLFPNGMASATAEPKYTFTTNADGNYKGDNIAPGSYTVIYRNPDTPKGKVVDQADNVKVEANGDTEQNFDMSRPEYLSKLTPEQRKAIEEARQKNAKILKENAQIKNLNGDLAKARQDDDNKNFADAETLMQRDVALMPDAPVLWVELGMAQRGLKQWSDCVTSLQKGIALDTAGKKPHPDLQGAANDAMGECYGSEGKIPEAEAAYDAAAKANPSKAGMYYQNETIILARNGQTDATVTAADKAIAADPTRPIPYYLKGQALINKATVDPKTQKIVAPPGCEEAYQKYLQLDPNGQFANDAKQVLAEMGQTQESSYKASKKKH